MSSPSLPASQSATASSGGRCRYCTQPLPAGRAVTFCPYCGLDVTRVRCPACSTELETAWRFCVTCGRTMQASDGATPG